MAIVVGLRLMPCVMWANSGDRGTLVPYVMILAEG
jgi:hypothetical protein